MKVFLSWSGDLSRSVAEALREWLRYVIQTIEPYVSSEDIHKGERWAADVAKELEDSQFGISCVTPDNLQAPWLHFEAGALSKTVGRAKVCPFLFGVKVSDLPEPLVQFQATLYQRDDVAKLVQSINSTSASPLPEGVVRSTFEKWWPDLQERLNGLEAAVAKLEGVSRVPAPRMTSDQRDAILEEMLELMRSQYRLLRSPEELLPPGYVRRAIGSPEGREHVARSRSEAQTRDGSCAVSGETAARLYDVLNRLAHDPGEPPREAMGDSLIRSLLDDLGLVSRTRDSVGLTSLGAKVFSQLGDLDVGGSLGKLRRVVLGPGEGVIRFYA